MRSDQTGGLRRCGTAVRVVLALAMLVVLGVALPACGGNSDQDCRAACSWWKQYCTGETLDGCIADCKDTGESAADAVGRCVRGQGWSTPAGCVSASCCLRWPYSSYEYQRQCL